MTPIFRPATGAVAARLLEQVPDQPQWVDIRGMLLTGHAAAAISDEGFVLRVVHGARSVVGVVGRPPAAAIAGAVEGLTAMTPVIAQQDNAAHVAECLTRLRGDGPEWQAEGMIVHTLPTPPPPAPLPAGVTVRALDAADSLAHLSPGLRHEMSHARLLGDVAVVLVDDLAAAFCYPCWTTDTWWDVSIDTLEPFRGRGLGRFAFLWMDDRMRGRRRHAVWSALESNTPSLTLARKLGFAPVDRIAVLSRGHWALLSGGFVESPAGGS